MLKLLLGDPNARKLKRYQPIVSDINLLEENCSLSDDELRAKTAAFQERLPMPSPRISARFLMRSSRKPLRWCAKPVSGCWACATSMCS